MSSRSLTGVLRQPLFVMSACLDAAGLCRFLDLKVLGFPTWPYALFVGGLYWALKTFGVKSFPPTDRFLIPLAYSMCGLFVSTIPNQWLVLVLSWYYSLLMPFVSPLFSGLNRLSGVLFRRL